VPRASTALLVSVAAHAVALGVVQVWREGDTAPVAPVVEPIELVPAVVEIEPIAIEFVELPVLAREDDPVVVATAAKGRERRRTGGDAPSISTGSTGGGGPATETTTTETTTTVDEPVAGGGLSEKFVEDFLARSKPLEPPEDIPGERVGNAIADARRELANASTDAERMAAREKLVALYDERDAEELEPAGGGTYKSDQGTFTAHVNADGTVDLDDAPNLQVHGLGGSFDLTDWAMRSHGDDPYTARKLEFLDRTRDQRVAIGKRHRKQQLERSAEHAGRNLKRMLAKLPDVASRKQALFELWDECAEAGDGDDDLVRGGAAARRMIVATIRSELAGANAYTDEELAAFNKKRSSKAKFAPYDDE
jgi:hypothetical protein